MLTTAQKHRILKEYNEERDKQFDEYQEQKQLRKTQQMEYSKQQLSQQDDDYSYTKLYKKLGDQHKNKDLREQVKGKLEEKEENKLGPNMWVSVNPQYRIDNDTFKSTFKESFKGECEEPVDKVYFRRKDESSKYAECLFKTKFVLSKK